MLPGVDRKKHGPDPEKEGNPSKFSKYYRRGNTMIKKKAPEQFPV
jgi:hypothetical protein